MKESVPVSRRPPEQKKEINVVKKIFISIILFLPVLTACGQPEEDVFWVNDRIISPGDTVCRIISLETIGGALQEKDFFYSQKDLIYTGMAGGKILMRLEYRVLAGRGSIAPGIKDSSAERVCEANLENPRCFVPVEGDLGACLKLLDEAGHLAARKCYR